MAYLDVVIGLSVAVFLLSLAPSALNEAIAFTTRIRSKFLWAYLNQIFTAPKKRSDDAANAPPRFFRRVTFRPGKLPSQGTAGDDALLATAHEPQDDSAGVGLGKAEAWGVPRSVQGLLRLMLVPDDNDPRPKASAADPHGDTFFVDKLHRQLNPISLADSLLGGAENKRTTVKYIPPASFAQAMHEVLVLINSDPADPASITSAAEHPDAIVNGIEKLSGTPIYPTLKTMWAASETKIEKFRSLLEHWFDAEMARLSGLYKRVMRLVLVVAAIVIAVTINVDPIALTKDLWRDPARRAQFLEAAQTVQTSPQSTTAGDSSKAPAVAPVDRTDLGALFQACQNKHPLADAGDDAIKAAAKQVEAVNTCVVDSLEGVRHLGLLDESVFNFTRFRATWAGDSQWLLRPLKLLLVAAALSLGAPFWYSAIQRLLGIRKTLAHPET